MAALQVLAVLSGAIASPMMARPRMQHAGTPSTGAGQNRREFAHERHLPASMSKVSICSVKAIFWLLA